MVPYIIGSRPTKIYYLERELIQKHPLSTAMKNKNNACKINIS